MPTLGGGSHETAPSVLTARPELRTLDLMAHQDLQSDAKDRLSAGQDWNFISRAESISTTGLSRNPTAADAPPSPLSQVGPVTQTPIATPLASNAAPKRTRFSFEQDEDKCLLSVAADVATNGRASTISDAATTNSTTVTSDGDGQAELHKQDDNPMSSFEKLCQFGDFSPGTIKLPSSRPPKLITITNPQHREKPLPQPPQIVRGSEYKNLLAEAVTGRATLVDTSTQVSQSPFSPRVASRTSPTVAHPTATCAATLTTATRATEGQRAPPVVSPLRKPAPDATETQLASSHSEQSPQFPPRVQSGSAFASLVSKMQRGQQSNPPSFSGMKNISSRFQAFKVDMQKFQKLEVQELKRPAVQKPRNAEWLTDKRADTAPPESSRVSSKSKQSGPSSDAKKTVVQKFLKRSSHPMDQTDQDGKKNSLRKFNNLLGRSTEQRTTRPSTNPENTPPSRRKSLIPHVDEMLQRQELRNRLPQLRQPQEQKALSPSSGRPRYYQAYSAGYSPAHSSSNSISNTPTASNSTQPNNTYSPFPAAQDQRERQGPSHSPYTADLHIRSRSPLSCRPDSQIHTPVENTSDPALNLGTFHTVSPKIDRIGDQEKPWNLSLPKDNGTERDVERRFPSRASPDSAARYPLPDSGVESPVDPAVVRLSPMSKPSTSSSTPQSTHKTKSSLPAPPQQSVTTASLPHSASVDELHKNARHIVVEPVELPVPGDDSSEEIVMYSTAYPDQEWRPAYVDGWD